MQIPVGGRDDPHIDLLRSRRAHRTDLALLQKSQQFELKALIHLSDFIEEHRTVIGRFKHADAVPVGSCVRAAHAPNNSLSISVGAIAPQSTGMKGWSAAPAVSVDHAREHFFARSCLALDETVASFGATREMIL